MEAPHPADEAERLAELRSYSVLDTHGEPAFDEIAALAATICGTPIALISFVDEGRQWFKSRVGIDLCETPRDVSFCAHAILEDDMLVVRDAETDARFQTNPFVVGEPFVRFYAGVPLRSSATGHAVGTVCVLDHTPRDLTAQQADALRALARRTVTELELRRAVIDGERTLTETQDSMGRLRGFARLILDSTTNAIGILDAEGRYTYVNRRACEMTGYEADELVGMRFIDLLPAGDAAAVAEKMRALVEHGESIRDLEVPARRKDGTVVHVSLNTSPVIEDGRIVAYAGTADDVTERKRNDALLLAQTDLLEMIAVGSALGDVLDKLCRAIERLAPEATCSILLVGTDGATLEPGAAPSLPDAIRDATQSLPIAEGVGSCGTAAYRAEPVIVENIAESPLWESPRDLVMGLGYHACWSVPIISGHGVVLGTFAVYYREPRKPASHEREMVAIATHIAGIAIERQRAESSVRSRTAELEAMYRRLVRAHADLEESKSHLEDKSIQLERALAAERARSQRDQLTGTLNHAAITDTLRDMITQPGATTLAVAMVDVDGLKAANDTYGHQIGDEVLIAVSQKLTSDGAIVGRYGGDEFIAILPGADRATAERYRDSVLASLTDAGLNDPESGAHVPVVASIGIAIYPDEAGAVDDLIRLSDSAMYTARRERSAGPGRTLTRTLGGDRAAKMVGEIVPLLTSPGATADKLKLVAHRLSVGAGYDGVHFVIDPAGDTAASSAFARVPQEDLQEWNEQSAQNVNPRVAEVLIRTRRPIIVDDIGSSELLLPNVARGLESIGLVSCLIAPMVWENTVIGAMSVASKQHDAFSVRDAEFVMAVATQVTAIVQMSRLLEQLQVSSSGLREAHETTVMMLASAAEAHDRTTGRHLERVRRISEALCRELGYDDERASALGLAATLHDIGKIRVPDSVLGSAKSLEDAEWVLMRQHTIWGSAFLSGKPGFELAAIVARHHHERWDGGGYPDGISGHDIPEEALITTVADSFDAMTNDRPYRDGRPVCDAVDEIVRCSGTQFSPRIVDALVRLFDRGELDFIHEHDNGALAA